LWNSTAGRYLRAIGLEQDIAMSARVSVLDVVPELKSVETGEGAPLYHFATDAG